MAALPHFFHLAEGQRKSVLKEPALGSVIPDLIIGIWNGELPTCSGLNSVARHVLAFLERGERLQSEEMLCQQLFLSHHASHAALHALQKVGAVTKRESGEVELQPAFDLSQSVRLVAIEVKLKRWRDALQQAVCYKTFSDEAYVVLDGNQVKLNDKITEAFIREGVGLFLQKGHSLTLEIAASSAPPRPCADRVFAVSKLASNRHYCLA